MVNLAGEKMSKSAKLYFLIEDIVADFEPELVRFYLSSTHYRSPIEFSLERLTEAGDGLRAAPPADGPLRRLDDAAGARGRDRRHGGARSPRPTRGSTRR